MTPACPLGLTALRMPTWTPQVSSYLDLHPAVISRCREPSERVLASITRRRAELARWMWDLSKSLFWVRCQIHVVAGVFGPQRGCRAGEAKGMEGEVTTNKAGNGHGRQGAATLRLSCIV